MRPPSGVIRRPGITNTTVRLRAKPRALGGITSVVIAAVAGAKMAFTNDSTHVRPTAMNRRGASAVSPIRRPPNIAIPPMYVMMRPGR